MKPSLPAAACRTPAWLARMLALALVLAWPAAPAAAGQQVWRCGAEGRVFSDRPCQDGSLQTINARPSAEDVDAAQALARREQKLAQTLAQERAERADIAPGAGLFSLGPTQAELEAARREREFSRLKTQRQTRPLPQRRLKSAADTSAKGLHASRRKQD